MSGHDAVVFFDGDHECASRAAEFVACGRLCSADGTTLGVEPIVSDRHGFGERLLAEIS